MFYRVAKERETVIPTLPLANLYSFILHFRAEGQFRNLAKLLIFDHAVQKLSSTEYSWSKFSAEKGNQKVYSIYKTKVLEVLRSVKDVNMQFEYLEYLNVMTAPYFEDVHHAFNRYYQCKVGLLKFYEAYNKGLFAYSVRMFGAWCDMVGAGGKNLNVKPEFDTILMSFSQRMASDLILRICCHIDSLIEARQVQEVRRIWVMCVIGGVGCDIFENCCENHEYYEESYIIRASYVKCQLFLWKCE